METTRIHITGASGAGTTTLGRALATALSVSHFDTDDFYWRPSNPPFQTKRTRDERSALMETMFLPGPDWVLSGAVGDWGIDLVPYFDAVVFVETPTDMRLERLRAREANRFGADAVAPGGFWHEEFAFFIEWASHYEDGTREGRNRAEHESWLATLSCPVLRVDGRSPAAETAADLADEIRALP